MDWPDVLLWQLNVLGKTAVAIDTQDVHFFADMPVAGPAGLADTTTNMPFGTDALANSRPSYVITDGHHISDKFVADGHTHRDASRGPMIPFINVPISAANTRMGRPAQDGVRVV